MAMCSLAKAASGISVCFVCLLCHHLEFILDSGTVCNVLCKLSLVSALYTMKLKKPHKKQLGFTQLLEKHPKGKKNFHQSEKRDVVVRTDTQCFEVSQTHWARAISECVQL